MMRLAKETQEWVAGMERRFGVEFERDELGKLSGMLKSIRANLGMTRDKFTDLIEWYIHYHATGPADNPYVLYDVYNTWLAWRRSIDDTNDDVVQKVTKFQTEADRN